VNGPESNGKEVAGVGVPGSRQGWLGQERTLAEVWNPLGPRTVQARCVLAVIIKHADFETGRDAYPDADLIAECTFLGLTVVYEALAILLADGWISRERRKDRPGTAYVYAVHVPPIELREAAVREEQDQRKVARCRKPPSKTKGPPGGPLHDKSPPGGDSRDRRAER
jgi:hypothetical protein